MSGKTHVHLWRDEIIANADAENIDEVDKIAVDID
jgi:hypothetical protein